MERQTALRPAAAMILAAWLCLAADVGAESIWIEGEDSQNKQVDATLLVRQRENRTCSRARMAQRRRLAANRDGSQQAVR